MGRALIVEADGGSRGNPGIAGYGALVRDAATGALLAERAEPLGLASNNVAEYRGMIAGLRLVLRIDAGADVEVRMDSKLVVEQMSGRWKIKHEDMRRLALEARDVAAEISDAGGSVTFQWVPREHNKAADALSNTAMDGEEVDHLLTEASVEEEVPVPFPEPFPPSARVVLVRHGVTDFTVQGRLDGRGGLDPSLNEAGRAQAAAAARAVRQLVGTDPVRVVTSTLNRAIETGQAVARALGVDLERDPDFDEQSFGDWDGVSVHELVTAEPEALERLRSDLGYRRPGGESHEEMAERVLAGFRRVVEAGGTTVVVCHRKPIMVVLADALGMPHDRAWRLAAAPGSLHAVEVWSDGGISVAFTNRT